ncbi:hypothetical protein J1N35_024294 [Gossypium stocksii]|uniref:Leucine-rich repeat-containing N-terminal plant-type domain-containing protein n=1 Tax=Gossypium stocksii TaxID=47602 RepID=A0A9D4A3Y8_9ROSI|nr:hypothetical protein J1N35_024294 [Gossypium stocksii]
MWRKMIGVIGALPVSISNASNFIEFDINGSNFTGKVNIDFGGLPGLLWLVLASNPLGRGEADDLDFLNSLTKCRKLQILDLSYDQLGGVIPDSIGYLSTQPVQLRLGGNLLWGSIPTGINNLVNLTDLRMQKNNMTGNIPAVIGNLKMLRLLDLSENQFSGSVSSIANLTRNCLKPFTPPGLATKNQKPSLVFDEQFRIPYILCCLNK